MGIIASSQFDTKCFLTYHTILCSTCRVSLGDNAPHDVWNETWTTQLDASQFIVDYLAEKMPSMTIYPAIGNHGSQ